MRAGVAVCAGNAPSGDLLCALVLIGVWWGLWTVSFRACPHGMILLGRRGQ